MAIVPATRVEAIGDGVTSLFGFGFPYESQADVHVTVNDVVTAFTFSAPNIVSILPAPANLSKVVIYRETPALNMHYIFTSGVPFLTKFADTNWRQLLYVFQEFVNATTLNAFNLTKSLRTPEVINTLPDAGTRANKIVGFDATGQPVVLLYTTSSVPGLDARLTVVENYVNILNAGRIASVPTFAGLSIIPAVVGQVVQTACHTSGTVGGSSFIAVAGTATPDNGTQIASATAGIYWVRRNLLGLTPYDFGVPANSSGDVRTLMQNAINVTAALKVQLLIPGQTFYFQLSADDQYGVKFPTNTNILGENGSKFELLPYAAYDSYQVVAIYDVDNVQVENLQVDGRKDLRTVNSTFTASITGNVMTVTGTPTGPLAGAMEVVATGVLAGTYISNPIVGTGTGGAGTYQVNFSQTVTSRSMIAQSGEYGMGFSIRGSTNIRLKNLAANNCYGDGYYFGQSTTGGLTYNKNVTYEKLESDGCRRQGASVISIKQLHGKDSYFKNVGNRAPASGWDFEPNSNTCVLEDIRIYNPTTENCFGFGIQIDISLLAGATPKFVDIKVFNHKDDGSNSCVVCSNANTSAGSRILGGYIEFVDCVSINAKNNAFAAGHWDYRATPIDFLRPLAIDPNRNGQTSPTTGSPFCVYRNSAALNYTIGNVRFIEARCILNSGTIPKNYFFDNTLNDGDEANNAFIDPIMLAASTSGNTMYRGQVSNKYNQGMRQSAGSETVTGDNAGLGILTATGAAATYTLSGTLLFANGPDIVIKVGGASFGASIALPAGGNFVGRAVNSGFTIGAGTQDAYMRIKPLGGLKFAVIENVGGWA